MNDTTIRVLIVDDEERFRQTTAAILSKQGFGVQAVGSGSEAIAEIQRAEFDVVVLDLNMPDMDGHEAFREIKNIQPDLAVLILTGHETPESTIEGLGEGIFDYLMKPCAIDLLAQRIREAFALKSGLGDQEPRVRHIMVPLSSFNTVHENQTVDQAVKVMLGSVNHIAGTSTVQETIHRATLVLGRNDQVVGIITFTDLLQGLQPPYMRLNIDKPQTAGFLRFESLPYSGMFTIMARDLAAKTVAEIMSDTPPIIDADANLMAAATKLLDLDLRRLLVVEGDRIVGVIREQDLFFEITRIIDR